ncbi:phage tail protein [Pseudoduganella sp. FT55W]|uniref:Phage tail protein n=1 Tax=Duganella rivi TaxID=2666083 RepID=A0A7X4GR29_9BURK|nr:phage tail protein [Duganella rivi]MYM67112.1 phage tail protein [Duganella rivi]
MSLFDDYPPAAFYFTVALSGSLVADMAFSEVSGIATEIELEPLTEGGENRFIHQLPKAVKHGNLELKRGIASMLSPLVLWCKDTLEGEFASMITLQTVMVMLRGGHGEVLRAWQFNDSYPVKWSVDGFSSTKNEVAIEKISLAYSYSQRVL